MKLTRENVLWLAGYFDGEGCLSRYRPNEHSGWKAGIKSTDEDLISKVVAIAGGSVYFERKNDKNPNHKDIWSWELRDQAKLYALTAAIYPFMSQRRQKRIEEFFLYFRTHKTTPGNPRGTAKDQVGNRLLAAA